SKPASFSDWCQMNSTGCSITDAIAWHASSSQFDPGNCTTPNFIARLPAAILTHRNSPEAPRALPCTTVTFLDPRPSRAVRCFPEPNRIAIQNLRSSNLNRRKLGLIFILAALLPFSAAPSHAQATNVPAGTEADYVIHDFHFKSGESLPELRIHYVTFGKPERDKDGRVTNAVLILHGTSGSSRSLLNPVFAGVLFAPGGLLDISHYYVIVPDGIGHGKSSKPSDGLHAKFPQYDYDDMVAAQHELVEKGLGVNHLRLVMGTSMGCM